MNKHCHRLIFNAARGVRMAVAETARSCGKAGSGDSGAGTGTAKSPLARTRADFTSFGSAAAVSAVTALALVASLALFSPDTFAQIKADPTAPGNQRPTVLQTANGVPLVNIQTPSAAGVSRNTYSQFDVQRNGAILNNSRAGANTQLAGQVQANPWLATGSARVILNEVNSVNPSQLKGYVEVAGQRAEVIIANPAGIQVDGGGFINASRATLTTGTPVMNGGSLESYRVQRGSVSINGGGLDARDTDYAAILARAVEANAALWAKDVTVVTGANSIDAAALADGSLAASASTSAAAGAPAASGVTGVTPITGTAPTPTFALDVAHIGGMYAGKIFLIGTEAGLGVNNRGSLAATSGKLVLHADGRLTNSGEISAAGNAQIAVSGVSNEGKLRAAGELAVKTADLNNAATGEIAGSNTVITARAGVTNHGVIDSTATTSTGLTHIEAASLVNAGTGGIYGGRLELAADGLLTNAGEISTAGDAQITSAELHNTGKVIASGDLAVKAVDISNASAGEIAGSNTSLAARSQLVNRGLIDSIRTTHIEAASLVNVGTGRIYGDHIAIKATDLLNDAETVAGASAGVPTTSAAVIAARERLDIGAQGITNREAALLFSAGDIAIGGALDASLTATGQANFLTNASATVEALGDLSIAASQVNNLNSHFSIAAGAPQTVALHEAMLSYQTTHSNYADLYFYNQVAGGSGIGIGTGIGGGSYIGATLASHLPLTNGEHIYSVMGNCWCNVPDPFTADWNEYRFNRTTVTDVVTSSAPGQLLAGGNLAITGSLLNDKSQVIAGGNLAVTGGSVTNIAATGQQTVTDDGQTRSHTFTVGNAHGVDLWQPWVAYTPAAVVTTVTLPVTAFASNTATNTGNTAGSAAGYTAPTSRLFQRSTSPTAAFVFQTDPRFAGYKPWLGTDAMLTALAYEPNALHKRLGDGFYEQKLIREQIAQLTGQRRLEGRANDEEQFQALMDSGVTYAREWQLVPGVALTAAQMAQLTSDIVWLVEREVTLADGTTVKALAPQVYLKPRDGDLQASGALLAGATVELNTTGDIQNSGRIAGRTLVAMTAQNVRNLGGEIDADQVAIAARDDVQNIGGSVSAKDVLAIEAGRDLEVRTTTRAGSKATGNASYVSAGVDRVAGLYVTGENGVLVASAGRDMNLVAAVVANGGANGTTELSAGRDVKLGTITESNSESVTWNAANRRSDAVSREVGTEIVAAGDVRIEAGRDVKARAADVQAQGALSVNAGQDVKIEAGEQVVDKTLAVQTTRKGFLSKSTFTRESESHASNAVASNFGGGTVDINAGRDVAVTGSNVIGDSDVRLDAGRDVRLEAARETSTSRAYEQNTKKGIFGSGGGGIGVTAGKREQSLEIDTTSETAAASTVGSIAGDVRISAGKRYVQTGSDVLAPGGDIDISAQEVQITEAREASTTLTEQKFKQSGLTLAISNPVLSAVETVSEQVKAAKATPDGRMKGLAAANSAMAANSALAKVRAGQGVDFENKSNQIVTQDAQGNKTGRDATGAERAGGVDISISLGSSKSTTTTAQTTSSGRGSSVGAGGDIRISASGAGQHSDLLIRGSEVEARGNVMLKAEGDVVLEAAKNTASLAGSSKSSSASIGLSIGTSGVGVTAAASKGRGSEAGDDVTYTNTHINAGEKVSIQSGADTTLRGAVVRADTVQADIGGDLRIESLQDTSTYDSKSKSVSASVTIGAGAGGSFSASKSNIQSDYASVTQQSGIKAGDGGFQVTVKGDTELKGGVIASNQAAVAEDRNRFSTGGELTTRDIQNKAEYSATSVGVSASAGGNAGNLSPTGASAGIGSDSGNSNSVTTAGISGIAGDAAVRSTDEETGIARIFDKEKVQRDIDAQVKITQEFSRQASKAVGDFAATQMKQATALREQANAEADPARQAELNAQADQLQANWGDNGTLRVAAHTLIGGLTGGASGAAGALTGTLAAPAIADALANAGIDETLAKSITALASTAVGAMAGGTAGGAAALNEVANNYLKHAEATRLATLKNKQLAGQCDVTCTSEIRELEALDQKRNQQLASCKNVESGECDVALKEVRSVAADYVRQNSSALNWTYVNEKNETVTLALDTMDGVTSAQALGVFLSTKEALVALGSAARTGFDALVLQDPKAQALAQAGAGAAWEFVKDPANWPALLGAMSAADREKLAKAYETGDGLEVGVLLGAQLANLPGGAGMGMIKKIDKVVDGAAGGKNFIGGTSIKTLADAADSVTAQSAAQAQKLQQELSTLAKVQPDTARDAFYLGNTDQNLLKANKFDMNHVLSGEINSAGKATGYHAELAAEGSARIRPGSTVTQNANGSYTAQVDVFDAAKGIWVEKVSNKGQSTFFNATWSQARIEYEVAAAFKVGKAANPGATRFEWNSPSGVEIRFFWDGKRTTFYPTGK